MLPTSPKLLLLLLLMMMMIAHNTAIVTGLQWFHLRYHKPCCSTTRYSCYQLCCQHSTCCFLYPC